jgi:signal transduction histidine kinase
VKNRRRRLIVEGNFQARFILRFILVIVGATLLATGAILGLFYFKYQYGGADMENIVILITPQGRTDVTGLFQIVLVPLVAANLLVLCIVVPFSLLYSHRIAGPIYRLEQSMEMLINGDMDFMITLRKHDEFKYLADRMNALIDFMRRNIREVRSSHRILKEITGRVSKIVHADKISVSALRREIIELERFFNERGKPFSY